jgi:protein TonB
MNAWDISITGSTFVIALVLMIAFVVGTILVLRSVFKSRADRGLAAKYEGKPTKSPLENRNKYEDVNVFSLSRTFMLTGLALSFGLIILAFSWTQYDHVIDVSEYMADLEEDIEVEPPRTKEPPPPPPPPPPPVIEEVPEEDIEEEPIEFEDQSIDEETILERPEPVQEAPPPPPPPPPPPDEPDFFKVVEEMPTFPGCESVGDKAERKKCADEKMLQFIYKNIKYPAIARENGVEGMVVVRFIVEKDGKITDAHVVRDIGAQCGQEALRVVGMMPKWNAGKQRGRPVRVQFNLPVRFKLE